MGKAQSGKSKKSECCQRETAIGCKQFSEGDVRSASGSLQREILFEKVLLHGLGTRYVLLSENR